MIPILVGVQITSTCHFQITLEVTSNHLDLQVIIMRCAGHLLETPSQAPAYLKVKVHLMGMVQAKNDTPNLMEFTCSAGAGIIE